MVARASSHWRGVRSATALDGAPHIEPAAATCKWSVHAAVRTWCKSGAAGASAMQTSHLKPELATVVTLELLQEAARSSIDSASLPGMVSAVIMRTMRHSMSCQSSSPAPSRQSSCEEDMAEWPTALTPPIVPSAHRHNAGPQTQLYAQPEGGEPAASSLPFFKARERDKDNAPDQQSMEQLTGWQPRKIYTQLLRQHGSPRVEMLQRQRQAVAELPADAGGYDAALILRQSVSSSDGPADGLSVPLLSDHTSWGTGVMTTSSPIATSRNSSGVLTRHPAPAPGVSDKLITAPPDLPPSTASAPSWLVLSSSHPVRPPSTPGIQTPGTPRERVGSTESQLAASCRQGRGSCQESFATSK
ncbi:hypothetical protein QJQ45_028280, partial [Haematococcus lacustris]